MSGVEMLQDGALGIKEAQTFSGVSRTTLYELMGQGRLPFVKVGARRLIPRRALIEVLAEGVSTDHADDRSIQPKADAND
jgi:excisionase family DNA binding protein